MWGSNWGQLEVNLVSIWGSKSDFNLGNLFTTSLTRLGTPGWPELRSLGASCGGLGVSWGGLGVVLGRLGVVLGRLGAIWVRFGVPLVAKNYDFSFVFPGWLA